MPRVNFLLAFTCCVLLFSCTERVVKDHEDPGALQKTTYATYFKIYRYPNYNLLVNYLNAQRSDSIVYALYAGEKPKLRPGVVFVRTPSQKVACLSSVFVGFLSRLGLVQQVGAVDNLDFISNPVLLTTANTGVIKELAKNGQLNLEQTLVSRVDLVFTNPSGDKKKDLDPRLVDAGIIPVVCADYFENHPLGRAEWIKAIALFFGREKEADSLFADTEKKYLALKASADTCKYRPTVFSELKTNDTWFVAGGESSLARFLGDAGSDYLWKDNGKVNVTAMNMEQVIGRALNADFWIHLHLCNSAADIIKIDDRYGEFKAFKNGNLYNNNALVNPKGGNAYWENGLCNPDEILSDLVKIFHPTLQPGKEMKYYKQLK